MKKTIIILFALLLSFTSNAQQLGLIGELGASWLAVEAKENETHTPYIYDGIGLFYEQTVGNSDRFDIRMDLYFNQYRYQKILEFNSTGISTRPYPEEIEYNYTMNYVTLSIMPVFQVVENLKIGLGLEYSLWTNSSVEEITTYYIIDSLSNNKQQTHKQVFIRKSTKGEFIDRSHYGAKLSASYQFSSRFDVGISYRYMGKFKLGPYIDPFFFNAITLTTHFYIKTK